MATTSAGETGLHYVRRGAGPPLLLIIGMAANHLHWGEPLLSELERDFDVIAYDHRGVGASSWVSEPFTTAVLAADAAALMDALEIESAHVLGISMGGMVAQELALHHPERIRTLTLGCTYCGGPGSALAPEYVVRRLTEAVLSGDRVRALRTSWEVNVSERLAGDAALYATFSEITLKAPVAVPVLMAQMRACAEHDTSTRLSELSAPTLVVHGTEDLMLPVQNARVIAGRIPGARLEILDGAGHMFFWEQPQRTAALVRELARAADNGGPPAA